MTQAVGKIYYELQLEEYTSSKWLHYRFNAIELPMAFSQNWKKIILKFSWAQKTPDSKCNLKKEKWTWRNPAPWLQPIVQSYSKTIWYCPQNRNISSVQFSSVPQSCPTLFDPMNRSTPGLPVHHQLPEFTQTHVHWVSDAIQASHPLSFASPPAPNPSQHQSLFQWVNSSHEVAKVLEFQL